MDEVERYFARLEELYGGIKRARGPFLYTQRGVRLTDLYQDDGRAILGWRAGGSLTVMKRTIERGATGSYRTAEAHRLARAVAALFSVDVPSSPLVPSSTQSGAVSSFNSECADRSAGASDNTQAGAVSSFNSEGTDQQGAASVANPSGKAVTPAGSAGGSLHTAGERTQAGAVATTRGEGGAATRAASGSNPQQEGVFRAHDGGSSSSRAAGNQSILEVLAFAHEEDCLECASAIAGHAVTLWRPWCDEGTPSVATGNHTQGGTQSSFNSKCSLSQGAAGSNLSGHREPTIAREGGTSAGAAGVCHPNGQHECATHDGTGSQHTAGRANPQQEAAFPAGDGGDPLHTAGGSTQGGSQAITGGTVGTSAGAAGVCHPNGQHECATHDGTGSAGAAMCSNPLRRDGCVAFCPPLPWGGGVYLVAARSDVIARCSDRASFARAIVLPPPVEAACARAVWDLIAALKTRCEQQWFIWDIYTMRYWLRRGPYLYPTVGRQAYSAFCEHCLKLGVVVNPCYDGASIVPYGAQRGILAVLRKAPFEQ